MKNLVAKGYDKGIDIYCKHITNHSHYKYSPYIHPLGHDNLQKFMLCVCHDKAAPIVTPLAPCQTSLQMNLEKFVHDNLQMRHQLFHLTYHNFKPDSFQVFQRKYHHVLQ